MDELGFGSKFGYPALETLERRLREAGWVNDGSCWVFNGTKATKGYGSIRIEGRNFRAHRIALEVRLGRRLMPSEVADHVCGNRGCVNPLHLRAVSQKDNVAYQTRLRENNKSGYRNVSWDANRGRWRVAVKRDDRQFAARFDALEDAIACAREFRQALFPLGEYDEKVRIE